MLLLTLLCSLMLGYEGITPAPFYLPTHIEWMCSARRTVLTQIDVLL